MTRRALILAATVLAIAPAIARAQPSDEVSREDRERARERFEWGVQAAASGDFSGALDAFRESYTLNPRPVVLLNIGSCQQQLGDLRGALESYRAYLATAGD